MTTTPMPRLAPPPPSPCPIRTPSTAPTWRDEGHGNRHRVDSRRSRRQPRRQHLPRAVRRQACPWTARSSGPASRPARRSTRTAFSATTARPTSSSRPSTRAVQDGVDILNLSLGADFGSADDPDSVALDNASEAGVICCVRRGQRGRFSYYITGDPSASLRDISVAASYNSEYSRFAILTGVAPSSIAGRTFSGTPPAARARPSPARSRRRTWSTPCRTSANRSDRRRWTRHSRPWTMPPPSTATSP